MGFDWRGLAKVLLLAALLLAGAASAATVQYVYDDLGRLVAAVDGTGNATVYTYDAAGNLLSVTSAASGQVSVVTFVPNHGKVGDTVTVYGSQFVPSPAQNTLSFNGTPAVVTAATANTLVTTVPAGATTGPVSVSNANGSATSAAAFTVVSQPVITGVSPDTVARGFTTRVQISGSSLRFATAVTFSQAGITALLAPGVTDSILPVELRVSASVPAGAYNFSVANAAGTTSSGAVTVTVAISPTGVVMSVGKPVSIFLPHPPQSAPPSGDGMSVSPATSVFLPQAAQSPPPSGDGMSVGQPTSVSMP